MAHAEHPIPVTSRRSGPLKGRVRVPGDKSISHRAMIFGLLAIGETRVSGLLEGEDVMRTAAAARALGAIVHHDGPGAWRVTGVGVGGLREPADVLDFGNAGTGSRLMMGVCGSHPITTTFDGDASLRKRPMRRILDPLEQMGTVIVSAGRGRARAADPARAAGGGADHLPDAGRLGADQIRRAAGRSGRAGRSPP